MGSRESTRTDDGVESFDDSGHTDALEAAQSNGDPVALRGYVWKRGGANPAFRKRWVVVTDFGRVVYFSEVTSSKPLGQFSLQGSVVKMGDEEGEFVILTPARKWTFKVEDEETMVTWVNKLNTIIASEFLTQDAGASGALKLIRVSGDDMKREKLERRPSTFVLDVSRARTSSFHVEEVPKDIQIACVTWNLAEKLPGFNDLNFMKSLRNAHFIVIGVQECKSMMYAGDKNQVGPASLWQAMCQATIGKQFACVAGKTMGPIHIDLYAHANVIASIEDLRIGQVSCGVGNLLYNKGAVSISFVMHGKRIGFICAHLAARTERIRERNANYLRIDSCMAAALNLDTKDIVSGPDGDVYYGCDGPPKNVDEAALLSETAPEASEANSYPGETIARLFDLTIFFGDLNYRIEGDEALIKNLVRCADVLDTLDRVAKEGSADGEILDMHDTNCYDGAERDFIEDIKNHIEIINRSSVDDEEKDDDDDDDEASEPTLYRTKSMKDQHHLTITVLGDSIADPSKLSFDELLEKGEEIKFVTGLSTSFDILQLLQNDDQLRSQKDCGRIFRGFREAPILFKPSYKFDPGTMLWDSSKKLRAPAWCDRVLVSSRKEIAVENTLYTCEYFSMHSDHRPVIARFDVSL